MQPLNFTQLSSKKHKAVRTWFFFNCVLIATLLGICLYLSIKQYKQYKKVRTLANTYSTQVKQKNNKRIARKNDVTHVLKTVNAKLTCHATLESLTLSEATVEFKIAGNTTQTIADITKQLQTSDNRIQLVGLENPGKNKVIGVFTY